MRTARYQGVGLMNKEDIEFVYEEAARVHKYNHLSMDREDFQQDCMEAALKAEKAVVRFPNTKGFIRSVVHFAKLSRLRKLMKHKKHLGSRVELGEQLVDKQTEHDLEMLDARMEAEYMLRTLYSNFEINLEDHVLLYHILFDDGFVMSSKEQRRLSRIRHRLGVKK
jgi:hypothetical protein